MIHLHLQEVRQRLQETHVVKQELLTKLKQEKEPCKVRMQAQVTQEKYVGTEHPKT